MKNLFTLLFACLLSACLLSVPAAAGTLTQTEVAALHAKIDALTESMFKTGDPQVWIAATHHSVYRIAGSKEAFDEGMRQATGHLKMSGVKFVSSKNGAPSRTYNAGDEEICFVPRVAILDVNGKQARDAGMLVAIRPVGGTEWKFLDAGLLTNEMLYGLLPKLERGVELPPK